MGSSWQQFSNATAPERGIISINVGAFPMDFKGVCDEHVKAYIKCLKSNKNQAFVCKAISKEYLKCRMDHKLMDRESFADLGFQEDIAADKERRRREKKEAKEKL